jgi:hypothetical protein
MKDTLTSRILRDKAREALRARKLPIRRADRMWGGRGVGAECSICSSPVKPDELEFELEYLWANVIGKHHVHIHCFTAWERERDDVLAQDGLQESA